jgi:hypothetical protein
VSLRGATAADDEQERPTRLLLPTRAGVCAPGSRPAWDHAVVRRGHSFLPASRATTHVVGKVITSSRRTIGGAPAPGEGTTIGASGRTPISSSRIGGRARRPLIGRACPDGGPGWGRRPLGHTRDDQETFEPRRGVALAFALGCSPWHAPGRRARVSSTPRACRASGQTPGSRAMGKRAPTVTAAILSGWHQSNGHQSKGVRASRSRALESPRPARGRAERSSLRPRSVR